MIFSRSGNGIGCTSRACLGLLFFISFSIGNAEFQSFVQSNKQRFITQLSDELNQKPEEIDSLFDWKKIPQNDVNNFFEKITSSLFVQKKRDNHGKVKSKTLTELYLKCFELCSQKVVDKGITTNYDRVLSKNQLSLFTC